MRVVIDAIMANSIRAILDYSLDNSPVLRAMNHVQGLLIGFGNQIWVLFYGQALWIRGLRFADRGILMGWQKRWTVV